MPCFLRNNYVFGVVSSRRLGESLGVNVLPLCRKVCTFNCIYCECGYGPATSNLPEPIVSTEPDGFPPPDIVAAELQATIADMSKWRHVDAITFSGNGEPTLHPNFNQIIANTIAIRNEMLPNAAVAVLSNATTLHRPDVVAALKTVDKPILKLDSASPKTMNLINLHKLPANITVDKIVSGMAQLRGQFILQTMFLRGIINGEQVNNTTDIELELLADVINDLQPKQTMIYPIDRATPASGLVKLGTKKMQHIAEQLLKLAPNTEIICVSQ